MKKFLSWGTSAGWGVNFAFFAPAGHSKICRWPRIFVKEHLATSWNTKALHQKFLMTFKWLGITETINVLFLKIQLKMCNYLPACLTLSSHVHVNFTIFSTIFASISLIFGDGPSEEAFAAFAGQGIVMVARSTVSTHGTQVLLRPNRPLSLLLATGRRRQAVI